ncbi:MAG: hypothetical protein IJ386_00390 [Clostridia bacterium]|nr:hypothetical protein [Clostridia bacterium]
MSDFKFSTEEVFAILTGKKGKESEESETDEAAETPAESTPEERIAELEGRIRQMEEEKQARERELLCLNLLGEAGLTPELCPAVMASPDPAAAVALIGGAVRTAVEAEIAKRCRSDAPAVGSRAPLTREELASLPVAELQRMRNMGIV